MELFTVYYRTVIYRSQNCMYRTVTFNKKRALFNLSNTTKAGFILGIILLDAVFLMWRYDAKKLSFNSLPVYYGQEFSETQYPQVIEIKKLSLSLPIYATNIYSGRWEVAKNGASFLAASGVPGRNNTIVLYAHNTSDRFGPIHSLVKGDKITLVTTNGKTYVYIVEKTEKVKPSEINILLPQDSETLMLYTSDGPLNFNRFVVVAKPEKP